MHRAAWLAERRAVVEADYTSDAPGYDEGYDPATPVHRRFVAQLVEAVPTGGSVLDAACGTAPYAGMVIERGRRYVGVDRSAGMLARARGKWPDADFERVGLQELAFAGGFGGVMCIDAMEHVPPEDWPGVLAGFRRALEPGGRLYLTVEQLPERGILDDAFESLTAAGVPVVYGEMIAEDTGGYHHYPDREQVHRWLVDAGMTVVDEADEWLDGYGYHHMVVLVR
jgi:ubiquinone/menaquinone biosynthesis C-methylase UbiE